VLGGRTAHQLQRRANFAVGKNVEEGRLFEIDGEGLALGAVEDRFAGGVDEIGEDDGVFLGEGSLPPRPASNGSLLCAAWRRVRLARVLPSRVSRDPVRRANR